MADVDGDGDVDLVQSFTKGFAYAEQRNGSFVILRSKDNPFFPRFLGCVSIFLRLIFFTQKGAGNPSLTAACLVGGPCRTQVWLNYLKTRNGIVGPSLTSMAMATWIW